MTCPMGHARPYSCAPAWLAILGESLKTPKFLISHRTAFARRLRRNYIFMFMILLFAWVLNR